MNEREYIIEKAKELGVTAEELGVEPREVIVKDTQLIHEVSEMIHSMETEEDARDYINEKYWDCDICRWKGHFNIIGDISDILQIIDKYKVNKEQE